MGRAMRCSLLPALQSLTVQCAESQPEKPGKGFLTSDYNRRGEFTDTIRTEQYRSQLKVILNSARGTMQELFLNFSTWLNSKLMCAARGEDQQKEAGEGAPASNH